MKKGFTLIELIVVIAIVLILAAILFPVFQRPHHGGRRIPCQSNLKQIGLAVLQYVQDYDEKYPPAKNSRHGLTKPLSWVGVIQPYIKSTQVFVCPSEENTRNNQSSYGYNAWLDERSTKQLKHPARVVLNFEVVADPNNWTQTGTGPQAVSAKMRHLDGANYSFADGHVKWLKPTQVTAKKPDGKNATFRIQ